MRRRVNKKMGKVEVKKGVELARGRMRGKENHEVTAEWKRISREKGKKKAKMRVGIEAKGKKAIPEPSEG